MSDQPGMAEIFPRIERSVQRARQMVEAMTPEQIHESLLDGDRSVKDVLGHMTWWDQWLLTKLPPAPGEAASDITLPLADQIPPRDHWADEMNAKVLAYNKARAFTEIWQEFTTTAERLLRRVSLLSDDDLYNPAGLAAVMNIPVAPNIIGIYEHYEEHAHEFARIGA